LTQQIVLALFGFTACGKSQPSKETAASISAESSETNVVEETTMTTVAETEPAILYPQIPGKSAEEFLNEMTIMTKACFERFFGTLEEYFKYYPILDDPFLEGFD
jgi:hypothetical protein